MDLTPEVKKQIDEMPYEHMLRRWRTSPAGDAIFQGESGAYFGEVMRSKRDADPVGHVKASKSIG